MDALSVIVDAFEPIGDKRLLDVGCGHGALVKALTERGAQVTGIDPHPQAVAAAKTAVPNARIEAASAEALPFDEAAFDGVVCLNALHHTADPRKALDEMARVVVPGGRIVVVEPLAEGSFFAALRPIEDETQVRANAQEVIAAALASGAFACEREVVVERRERFENLDAFIARTVAVDPAREAAARAHRSSIEAAFAATPERDEAGRHVLVQPLRVHVLTAGRPHRAPS